MLNNLSNFCLQNSDEIQNIYNIISYRSNQYFTLYHNKTITSYEILSMINKEFNNHNNIDNIEKALLSYFPYITFPQNIIFIFKILTYISYNNIGNLIIDLDKDGYDINNINSNSGSSSIDISSNYKKSDRNRIKLISCLKDIKFFYPSLIINVYIFDRIDEKYNYIFNYIDNLFCRKASIYSYYVDMKSFLEENKKIKFSKLFYIKFTDTNIEDDSNNYINNKSKLIINKYEKGITFGTFDLFHYGHDSILKRCRNFCDYLCLGLSSDELNKKKGKKSIYDYNMRKKMIESPSEKYVDMVFKEESLEDKDKHIIENKSNILMMGDDWLGKFDWVSCNVLYMERTPNISTTMLKEYINNNNKI
jgi:glycerol-3-phosphate cytidylyltransferase